MDKKLLTKGIESVIAGLNSILDAVEAGEGSMPKPVEEPVKESKTTEEKVVKKSTPKKESAPVEVDGDLAEKLEGMKFNELKKYAASVGVDAKGKREDIIARILGADTTSTEEEPVEEKSNVTPISKGKKAEKKEDKFDEQAKEFLKEMEVKDVIDALDDVGVKADEKNVQEKLAYALREGLIEAGDDEDEDTEDEDTEEKGSIEIPDDEDEEEEEIDGETYFSEYDDGTNDPSKMSKKRKKAVVKLQEEKLQEIEDEKLSMDDIVDFLSENVTEEEAENIDTDDEESVIGNYLELVKRLVDDDGELHAPNDPYEIGGENYCCGHKLNYDKKTGKYTCAICGEEYDSE